MKPFHLRNKKKKESNKRENWLFYVQIISTVLSGLSFIFVAFTFFEMKVQRESSYKPIISIANSEILTENYRPKDLSLDWVSYSYGAADFTDSLNKMPPFFLKLENVGLGTARNVEVTWDKDNLKVYREYLDSCYNAHNTTKVTLDEDGDLKIIKSEKLVEPLFKENISKDVANPFLKPVDTGNVFEVDATFFSHLIAFCYFTKSYEEKPKICLQISYEDIYSKKYKTNVVLNFEFEDSINAETDMVDLVIKILPNLEYTG